MAATRAVIRSLVRMLEEGATHLGVATDSVVESFRNDLWPGYKTGEGIAPELHQQFPLLDDAVRACGITLWGMTEFEADDALGAAAAVADADPRVTRVLVCTPDKDLAQVVRGTRVVQYDRRKGGTVRSAADVVDVYGVPPGLIPDWLALVGDTADGFPGLPGFGAKGAAGVLNYFGGLEAIPLDAEGWRDVPVRGAARLAATFAAHHNEAMLFRTLATLRTDAPVGTVDDWRWRASTPDLAEICRQLDAPDVPGRLDALAAERG